MRINGVLWKGQFLEKIAEKHGTSMAEVEEVLFRSPFVRRAERGKVRGEDLYAAYGQTLQGRYLVVFFIRKRGGWAMPITARSMTSAERRYYRGQKGP